MIQVCIKKLIKMITNFVYVTGKMPPSPRLSLALFGLCQTGARELRQLASHPGVTVSWIVEKDIRFAEKMTRDLLPQFDTNIVKPSYAHLVYEDPK